jgi:hypothetical protein
MPQSLAIRNAAWGTTASRSSNGALVETIRASVAGMSGLRLLKALKRDQVKVGPYPHVTLFEAANRIMTDMVILYGVKWILGTPT